MSLLCCIILYSHILLLKKRDNLANFRGTSCLTDSKASQNISAIHVLHVDDDQSILEISKQILVDMDKRLDIDSAFCVDEALKKLSAQEFDVIISDYEIPQKWARFS